MIIFGFGGAKPRDLGPVVLTTCPNCRNETTFHYVKHTKWFRLYFVPLVPYSTKHYLQCPVCDRGMELTREQAQQACLMVSKTTQFLAQELDQAVYRSAVDHFWSVMSRPPAPDGSTSPSVTEESDDGAL